MNKVLIIANREFTTRIRKKSFWIMAVLGPVFFAVMMIVPLYLGMKSDSDETKVIEVLDPSGKLQNKLPSSPDLRFAYFNGDLTGRLRNFLQTDHIALIHFSDTTHATLYIREEKNAAYINYIKTLAAQAFANEHLESKKAIPNLSIQTELLSIGEEDKGLTAKTVIALFSSILILFYILLYGGQVMRGVIEEKSNRILEVMISSVKPFQLMLGKILGTGIVSLTQFLIWITLTFSLGYYINQRYEKVFDAFSDERLEQTLKENPQINPSTAFQVNQISEALRAVDFSSTLFLFLFYFTGGYLLYGAIFAGLASTLDSETDTQQFVFPLIAPLMLCMVFATQVLKNPHGDLAFWLSMIPFTSPIVILLRIPFGIPMIQLLSSMAILTGSFLIFTWISSRIYRVGILMYGKKANLKEVGRWIFYKF